MSSKESEATHQDVVPASLVDWHATTAGNWKGTNLLRCAWEEEKESLSESTITSSLRAGDTGLEISYTWIHKGKIMEGVLLVAVDGQGGATGGWIDSWHQSTAVLALTGSISSTGVIDLMGHYPAPEGPPWGWNIVVCPPGGMPSEHNKWSISMYNIKPGGQPDLAVRGEYTRHM